MKKIEFLKAKDMKKIYFYDKINNNAERFFDFSILDKIPEIKELEPEQQKSIINQVKNSLTSISDLALIDFYIDNNIHVFIDLDFIIYRVDDSQKMLYRFYFCNAARIAIYDRRQGYSAKAVKYYEIGKFSQNFKNINYVEIA